jgi:predicted transcriptional regulator
MKKHGLSVRVFAKLSSVSYMTLYRLEEGQNEITLSTIRKLDKTMREYKDEKNKPGTADSARKLRKV